MTLSNFTLKQLTTIELFKIIFFYSNFEFYGLQLKSESPPKVVIKGIPIDSSIKVIKEELTTLGFDVHTLSQLRNFKTKQPLPVFLVYCFRNEQFCNFFSTSELLGFRVTIDMYKFKGTKQCDNC